MFQDLAFAVRGLIRSPGFTSVAVTTVALAIGANAAIFCFADAVLFRPLPYVDPDGVYVLQMADRRTGIRATMVPFEQIQALNDAQGPLRDVAMLDSRPAVDAGSVPHPDAAPAVAVTTNYFQVLSVQPARGRLFDANDGSEADRVAVLSYRAWRQRFGADEQIVGRSLRVNDIRVDVVGVLPADFVFPTVFAGRPDVIFAMPSPRPGADGGTLQPIVRLKPGLTRAQAQAEIDARVSGISAAKGSGSNVRPVLDEVRALLYPTGQPLLKLLLVASGLVLLISCANLVHMLLARMVTRERDMCIRAALGANRLQIVRPVVLETAMIVIGGVLLSVTVTYASFDLLIRQVPPAVYRNALVGVDARVIIFALAIGLAATLAMAAFLVWRTPRADGQPLTGASPVRPRSGHLGRPMMAFQVALAIVLVHGAMIAVRSMVALLSTPLGFTSDHVITLTISPPGQATNGQPAFYRQLVQTIKARSDVVSVGAASAIPLDDEMPDYAVRRADGSRTAAGVVPILPGYFETIGIPLRRGRQLEWDDAHRPEQAALLSESAARLLFPGRDPIGLSLTDSGGRLYSIVGIVGDVGTLPSGQVRPLVYAVLQLPRGYLTVVARMRRDGALVPAELRQEVLAIAPGASVTARWWTTTINALSTYRIPRFRSLVLSAFGGLSLGLTMLGVFGIAAFRVAVRTRELGIRLALGAAPGGLVRLMISETLIPVVSGLLVGFALTFWVVGTAAQRLFGLDTRDVPTAILAAAVVLASAAVAAYIPARRATRVDPLVVLRVE
jgi:putative ABC transport system permease protein